MGGIISLLGLKRHTCFVSCDGTKETGDKFSVLEEKITEQGQDTEEEKSPKQRKAFEEVLDSILSASLKGAGDAFKRANIHEHANELNPIISILQRSPPLIGRFITTSNDEYFPFVYFLSAGPLRIREFIKFAHTLINAKQPMYARVTDPESNIGPHKAAILKWGSPVVEKILNDFGAAYGDPEYPGMNPGKRIWYIVSKLSPDRNTAFLVKSIELVTIGEFDPFIKICIELSTISFKYLKPGDIYWIDRKRYTVKVDGELSLPLKMFV